jgi:periplasmic protein TonB
MTRMNATDPMQGTQEGRNMQSQGVISTLPGTSPLLQLSWLREVFRYRNQEYGAYSLRQQYPRNMMWGGLLSISLIGLLYGGSLLAKALQEKLITMTEYNGNILTPPPPPEEATPPPPPPVAPPPPPARPTIAFVVPKVEEDDKVPVEYEPPTQADLVDKNPGTVTAAGDPDGRDFIPEDEPEMAPPPVIVEAEPQEPKETKPFVVVEQMPAFRGNLHKYLAEQVRYPDIAKENGIEGTVVIQFVVNEKGEISNAFIVKDIGGGCGEEALRVVRGMPLWLPGANRGRQVKVQMSLPVKFKLE